MTPEQTLSTRLQEDITWRIRELSELVRATNEATSLRKEALLRASVPVLYAHWEGFFVYATNCYLNFLAEKRVKIGELKDEFWALSIRKRYKPNQISGDIQFSRFLIDIKSDSDRLFKKGNFDRINAKSNLRSETVTFCCMCIGVDPNVYADYLEFIDDELIEKRNYIAHGASLRFEGALVGEYRDKIVDLMRITYNEIENAAIQGLYKKPTTSAPASPPPP